MNKKYLLYVLTPVLAVAVTGGVVLADNKDTTSNSMSNLVSAIAQKFNLNPVDVQTVVNENFKQNMQERQAEMLTKLTERVNKEVLNGKLTQAQADLIIAKHTEMQNFMKNQEGKTMEEIQASKKSQMDSLKQWAKDNNIPEQYAQFGGLGKFGPGKGQGMGACKFAK